MRNNWRSIRDEIAEKVGVDSNMTADLFSGRGKEYETGYQVSFQTSSGEDLGDAGYISDDEFDMIVELLIRVTGTLPDLGVYGAAELSFHVESFDVAMAIASRYNQESIWDWVKKDVIMNEDYDPSTNRIEARA